MSVISKKKIVKFIPYFILGVLIGILITHFTFNKHKDNTVYQTPQTIKADTIKIAEPQQTIEATPTEQSPTLPSKQVTRSAVPKEQPQSVCDLTISTELSPGNCRMTDEVFNFYLRTVTPDESTKTIVRQLGNQVYRSTDTNLYLPICDLPLELKANNPDYKTDYRMQLVTCVKLIQQALIPGNPIASTQWGLKVNALVVQ